MKNLLQRYITTALTMLYLNSNKPNAATFYLSTREFYKFKQDDVFIRQPASLQACQKELTTSLYISLCILPSNFLKINFISVSMNISYFDRNTQCAPSPVLCSFILTNWFSCLKYIKVLTFNHGIIIPYKVLKLYSKQFG